MLALIATHWTCWNSCAVRCVMCTCAIWRSMFVLVSYHLKPCFCRWTGAGIVCFLLHSWRSFVSWTQWDQAKFYVLRVLRLRCAKKCPRYLSVKEQIKAAPSLLTFNVPVSCSFSRTVVCIASVVFPVLRISAESSRRGDLPRVVGLVHDTYCTPVTALLFQVGCWL